MTDRVRSWEAARALARHLGEQVSAMRGEALWLRDYPAAVAGDIGRVVIGVARRSVHRSCAVVSDLGALLTITVEAQRGGAAVWIDFRGNQAGTLAAVEAISAAIEQMFGAEPRGEQPDPDPDSDSDSEPEPDPDSDPDSDRESEPDSEPDSDPISVSDPAPASDPEAARLDQQHERELRRRLRLLGATSTADQRPGLLDAGYALLDSLGQQLAVPEARWRLELWGEGRSAGGASISLAGGPHAWEHLVTITAGMAGARLRIPGAAMGAAETSLAVPTVAALAGALANVVALVRAAVDGRAAFRARKLSALRLAERIAAALRADNAVPHVIATGRDDGFPVRWPSASVVERTGVDHLLFELAEQLSSPPAEPRSYPNWDSGPAEEESPARPFVAITVDEHVVHLFDEAHLDVQLPELVARARRLAARLTPARLGIDQLYEVLRPFHGLERGARLRYAACHSDPRGEMIEYRFHALGAGRPLVSLVDYSDDAILRELHRYLALVRG